MNRNDEAGTAGSAVRLFDAITEFKIVTCPTIAIGSSVIHLRARFGLFESQTEGRTAPKLNTLSVSGSVPQTINALIIPQPSLEEWMGRTRQQLGLIGLRQACRLCPTAQTVPVSGS
jgi:hypothetical protein